MYRIFVQAGVAESVLCAQIAPPIKCGSVLCVWKNGNAHALRGNESKLRDRFNEETPAQRAMMDTSK